MSSTSEESPGRHSRSRRWLERFQPLLPWLSLAVGVASAVLMDRGPRQAVVVAGAAVAGWLTLIALQLLSKLESDAEESALRRRLLAAARFSSVLLTQSLTQLCVFFSLPFYYQASTLNFRDGVHLERVDPAHAAFMLALATLCGFSLWDPWTEKLLKHPRLSPWLPAASSFLALATVLPGFGLSTGSSLWVAAVAAALAGPLIAVSTAPSGERLRLTTQSAAIGLTIPFSLAVGAARAIPPSPLRLVRAELGIHQEGKWISQAVTHLAAPPERLICATAIASPLGLEDRLQHVWHKDGREIARLDLEIVGGRKLGYRTRSWLSQFDTNPAGKYQCSVVTASGQLLGTRSAWIAAPADSARNRILGKLSLQGPAMEAQ